jgi:intracellular sulfur oxidation DsrE/DsrF family protein
MFRRAFLSQFSAATALFTAQPPAPPASKPWSGPARHAQDDWLDQAPEKHRAVFDTWLADKFGAAAGFAANWIRYNKESYGLADGDLAVVIVARHGSTPFAFNEAMWAKYGKIFADNMSAEDKTAHPNPTTNRYAGLLERMTKQGLRLAVCNVTLRAYLQIIAKEAGVEEDAVRKELVSNVIGNAVVVPAGVIAVTRAQERGYALVSIG